MQQKSNWKKGDWVKGRTVNGELMHGFIVDCNQEEGTVKVHVVACDRETTVGRVIETIGYLIKPLPELPLNGQQLRSMTDLALITADRDWFMQLSEQLSAADDSKSGDGQAQAGSWYWSAQH
ncbi:IDEAL domain-containing protein [Sporolactobacillus sp. CPB3-1]|uniref:IDEAL domain-containing protein n=1 Tax=Sporolactobacillus mangiferae TaxID=2940498 RepID=A0ABT0M8K0_9BACL|nr:IDEAL domain-containing protein [Sporolactobacillus mangiferae]MCL1631197.1 IDEAL domain-containing protein [Sporolactobacillus mangiferae]